MKVSILTFRFRWYFIHFSGRRFFESTGESNYNGSLLRNYLKRTNKIELIYLGTSLEEARFR